MNTAKAGNRDHPLQWNEGNRIVDMGMLAQQLMCKDCHTFLDLRRTEKEERMGFASILYVMCSCGAINDVHTQNPDVRLQPASSLKGVIDVLLYGDFKGRELIISFLVALNIPLPTTLEENAPITPTTSPNTVHHPSLSDESQKREMPCYSPHFLVVGELSAPANGNLLAHAATSTLNNTGGRTYQKKKPKSRAPPSFRSRASVTVHETKVEVQKSAVGVSTRSAKYQGRYNKCNDSDSVDDEVPVDVHPLADSDSEIHGRPPSDTVTVITERDTRSNDLTKTLSMLAKSSKELRNMAAKIPTDTKNGDEYTNNLTFAIASENCQELPAKMGAIVRDTLNTRPAQGMTRTAYKCPECNKNLPSEKGLIIHLARLHQNRNLQAQDYMVQVHAGTTAQDDGSDGTSLSSASRHTRSTQKNIHQTTPELINLLQCRSCSEKFESRSVLMAHRQEKHPRLKTEYPCENCNDVFKNNNQLRKHKKAAHPRGTKYIFTCDKCAKQFSQLCLLKQHERKHTGELPFKCFHCDTWFRLGSHRNNHIMRNHTKVRKELCETCGATFYLRRDLQIHERKHTGEKPLKCKYCSCSFARGNTLRLHLRLHTGEKPYECQKCGEAFVQSISLKTHYKSKHPELVGTKVFKRSSLHQSQT